MDILSVKVNKAPENCTGCVFYLDFFGGKCFLTLDERGDMKTVPNPYVKPVWCKLEVKNEN